jgi:SsrA-binding protein
MDRGGIMVNKVNINNRKAKFDYEFIRTLTAGMQLMGSEVKAIRDGRVSFVDSYCYFKEKELFLKNLNITPISSTYTHEPNRERKLLLNRRELKKLESDMDRGMTIVPFRIFTNEKGLIKLDIALAKGKKEYNKRQSIKEKDIDRDTKRSI